MEWKIISIPFESERGFDSQEFDTLGTEYEIFAVREHWFEYGGHPWLAVMVAYGDKVTKERSDRDEKREKDPRRTLNNEDKLVYDALRANQDGVPPYLVFNNRHLAEIPHIVISLGEQQQQDLSGRPKFPAGAGPYESRRPSGPSWTGPGNSSGGSPTGLPPLYIFRVPLGIRIRIARGRVDLTLLSP